NGSFLEMNGYLVIVLATSIFRLCRKRLNLAGRTSGGEVGVRWITCSKPLEMPGSPYCSTLRSQNTRLLKMSIVGERTSLESIWWVEQSNSRITCTSGQPMDLLIV